MADLSEKGTREQKIDKQLKDAGWLKKCIKAEVNSVKSNFKSNEYVLHSGSVEKGVDRYIDYLLVAEDNSSLAIVEAKKLNSIEVPIPPITLQNQFAKIVEEVEQLKQTQEKSKEEIDNLYNKLMQQAFKGEL